MSGIILELDNVHFAYEDGSKALNGISFKIKRGERLAVIGSNGSGKSTLFLNLNGVLRPTSGTVLIDGIPVDYSRRGLLELRRRVGIVFQEPDNQLFCASVAGEISFGAFNLGLDKAETEHRVNSVMEELNITPFKAKPTHFLSTGQKKRVTIADILVMQPDILILDEPAAALDPKHARMIDGIIDELCRKGITVILSTHDADRALIWADRVILLDQGTIIADGKPDDIFTDLALLNKANQEQPAVISVFDALCSAGVLSRDLKLPHTVQQLQEYILERNLMQ